MLILLKIREKLKRHSTKIEKTLVEYKTVTNINLETAGSQFLPVFTETTLEIERNKIK